MALPRLSRVPRFRCRARGLCRAALAAALAAFCAGCCSSGRLIEHDGVAYWNIRIPNHAADYSWDILLRIPTNYPGAAYSQLHRNGTHLLPVKGSVAYYDRAFAPLPLRNPDDRNRPNETLLGEYDRWIDPGGTMILGGASFLFEKPPPGRIVNLRLLGEAEQFMVAERKLFISSCLK